MLVVKHKKVRRVEDMFQFQTLVSINEVALEFEHKHLKRKKN